MRFDCDWSSDVCSSDLQVFERHTHLRDDHLRYMQKWGLIQPSRRAHGEVFYAFAELATIRQADAELAEGASFRSEERRVGKEWLCRRLRSQSQQIHDRT